MRVFALYNMKGGVGKTASAVNLAYCCSKDGYRTLIWDLDPQGASTFYFRIKPKIKGGAKKILKKRCVEDYIKSSNYANLDVIPADISFRNFDIELDAMDNSKKQLKKMLKSVSKLYDVVFLDCPPGISLLSENIFDASDCLVIPMIPTTLSLRTYEQVMGYFSNSIISEKRVMPFFSMVDFRKTMHKDIMKDFSSKHNTLANLVPYIADVEKMGIERAPVAEFSKKSIAARAYVDLWEEIKQRSDVVRNWW